LRSLMDQELIGEAVLAGKLAGALAGHIYQG
jgi:hypothetical protein